MTQLNEKDAIGWWEGHEWIPSIKYLLLLGLMLLLLPLLPLVSQLLPPPSLELLRFLLLVVIFIIIISTTTALVIMTIVTIFIKKDEVVSSPDIKKKNCFSNSSEHFESSHSHSWQLLLYRAVSLFAGQERSSRQTWTSVRHLVIQILFCFKT